MRIIQKEQVTCFCSLQYTEVSGTEVAVTGNHLCRADGFSSLRTDTAKKGSNRQATYEKTCP